jgi:serine/threonine protein phosphatase PrpC
MIISDEKSSENIEKLVSSLSKEYHSKFHNFEKTTAAKNPSIYETYSYLVPIQFPSIKIFSARKIGSYHIIESKPCQDYCMTYEGSNYTVLTIADGISSCERSDVGSRLACDSAIKTINSVFNSSNNEDHFLSLLELVSFKENLVINWIRLVMQEHAIYSNSQDFSLTTLEMYASTVAFAVITPKKYVVGNLGDGQVLVFNDSFGIKLRVHSSKDRLVKTLVNYSCALEDLYINSYPRSHFNGVLLSTDGMYDNFDKNIHFYRYASQLKSRFTSLKDPEPLQPFCYEEEGKSLKDFSVFGTGDDCSIVLGIDNGLIKDDISKVFKYVSESVDSIIPKRYDEKCLTFYVIDKGIFYEVVTSLMSDNIELPIIKNAQFLEPFKRIDYEQNVLSYYEICGGKSIELMFSDGDLKIGYYQKSEEGEKIVNIYCLLVRLQNELINKGFTLNESSSFLISYNNDSLCLRSEAISKLDTQNSNHVPKSLSNLFLNLCGTLKFDNRQVAIFDTGYVKLGMIIDRFDNFGSDRLCQVIKEGNINYLKNIGEHVWILSSGDMILSEDSVILSDNFQFTIEIDDGVQVEYSYITKENLS